MGNYRELDVWKESMDLVKEVYVLTSAFPKAETFGLTSQMRRSAVSVPCNIAEGKGRRTYRDYRRFVDIARGSTLELETQLLIARDLDFVSDIEPLLARTGRIGRMLSSLIRYLGTRINS